MSGFQRSNSSDEHDQLGLPSAHLVKKTFKNGEMGRELVRADLPAESISASTQRTREPLLNEPRIHVMLTIRVMCRRILTFVSGLFNDEGDTLEPQSGGRRSERASDSEERNTCYLVTRRC